MAEMIEWPKSTTVVGTGQPVRSETSRAWWQSRWAMAGLLFAISACYFWRITFTDQYTWLNGADLASHVLPWFQFQVGELQRGRLPFWDPYMFGGQPLIGQAQPGTAYPLNWLLFLAPTRHGWMRTEFLNWYYTVIHFMAVAFAYWLCRDNGLSRMAAVFGGLIYGLGGYMGHVDWPQMINGAVWIPLVLMFLLRVGRHERVWANSAKAGLCLGVSYLSGHHQVPIYITLMSAGVWAWILFRAPRLTRRHVALVALFFVVAGLASSFQALPGWEYSKHAVRWVGAPDPVSHTERVPYSVHEHYSFKPYHLVSLAILHSDNSLNSGVVAILLMVLGIALAWDRVAVRVGAAIAAGGLLYALGASVLFHGVAYSLLPLIEKARNPLMAVCVLQVGVALVAAHAIDRLGDPSPWMERMQKICAGLGAFVFAVWYLRDIVNPPQIGGDARSTINAVAALLAAAILAGIARGAISVRAASVCLLGLMLIELGQGAVAYLPHKLQGFGFLNALPEGRYLAKGLQDLPNGSRAEIEDQHFNVGEYFGVETWNAHLASLTSNVWRLSHSDRGMELFGVEYYVGKAPRGVWTQQAGMLADRQLFRSLDSLPRTWIVHQVEQLGPGQLEEKVLRDTRWDIHAKAAIETPAPKLEQCAGPDRAFILRRVSNRVDLWTETNCRAMVILADTYYPGWNAWVDGKPAEIQETFGALRGVVIDKGAHRVEMRYRPWSVYAGFLLSALGVAVTIVIARLDRG